MRFAAPQRNQNILYKNITQNNNLIIIAVDGVRCAGDEAVTPNTIVLRSYSQFTNSSSNQLMQFRQKPTIIVFKIEDTCQKNKYISVCLWMCGCIWCIVDEHKIH